MVKRVMYAAIAAALILPACATKPLPPENPRSIWCDQNKPQRLSSAEIAIASDERLVAVNAHNRKGEAWCGWMSGDG